MAFAADCDINSGPSANEGNRQQMKGRIVQRATHETVMRTSRSFETGQPGIQMTLKETVRDSFPQT